MYTHRMVRTLFHLDEAIHARLRDLARKKGRTVSELVREALVGLISGAFDSTTQINRSVEREAHKLVAAELAG